MRIASVRVADVARIAAVIYAVLGLIAFLVFAVGSAPYLTLPFGFIAPLFHLNLNLNLGRSSNVIYSLFACVASILSYSASGWFTGAISTLGFNFVAKRMGGVDARWVTTVGQVRAKG